MYECDERVIDCQKLTRPCSTATRTACVRFCTRSLVNRALTWYLTVRSVLFRPGRLHLAKSGACITVRYRCHAAFLIPEGRPRKPPLQGIAQYSLADRLGQEIIHARREAATRGLKGD